MIGLLRRRSGERARYAPTPTNGSAIIQTRGLTREYHLGGETVHALRGVDVEIERNEYVAVMGPSGSGESTLMNVIGCLDTPSAGNYWLNGHPRATTAALSAASRKGSRWQEQEGRI